MERIPIVIDTDPGIDDFFLPCAGLRLFRPPGPARRDHHGRQ